MMRPSLAMLAMLPVGALALPGCPSPEPGPSNPATLWLSPVGNDEKHVQLIDHEPPPF
jgi:hypothetical protein